MSLGAALLTAAALALVPAAPAAAAPGDPTYTCESAELVGFLVTTEGKGLGGCTAEDGAPAIGAIHLKRFNIVGRNGTTIECHGLGLAAMPEMVVADSCRAPDDSEDPED